METLWPSLVLAGGGVIGCVYSKKIRVSQSKVEQEGGLVGTFLNKTYENILYNPDPRTLHITQKGLDFCDLG